MVLLTLTMPTTLAAVAVVVAVVVPVVPRVAEALRGRWVGSGMVVEWVGL